MILRSLKVLRFGGLNPGAVISGFPDGITLIHGPNEAGKSTLLRGLTYVLYQRHSLTGDAVTQEILPAGSQVAPRVELVFEHDGRTWRIAKQFLKNRSAELAEQRNGVFVPVAEGTDADDQLKEMLGSGFAGRGMASRTLRGIGQILIVDQGSLRFDEGLGEQARASLQGVIQEVAVTGPAHNLLARLQKRYDAVYTPRGELKSGAQAPELVRLEEQATEMRRRLQEFGERRQAADRLELDLQAALLTPEEEEQERAELFEELKAARGRQIEFEKLKVELGSRAKEAAAARQEAAVLETTCRRLAVDRSALDTLGRELKTARQEETDRAERLVEARRALQEAETALGSRQELSRQLGVQAEAVTDVVKAQKADEARGDLQLKLKHFEELAGKLRVAEAALAARPRPKKKVFVALRRKLERLAELKRDLALLHLRVIVRAEKALRLQLPGGEEDVASGRSREIDGTDPLRFGLPGVASFEVTGPPVPQRTELESEEAELGREVAELTAPYDTRDLATLEQLWNERDDLEREIGTLRDKQQSLFADDQKVQDARERLAAEESTLSLLLARHEEWGNAVPAPAHLRTLEHQLKDAQYQFENGQASATSLVEARREIVKDLDLQQKTAAERIAALGIQRAAVEGGLATLLADGLADEAREAKCRELAARADELEAGVALRQETLEALGDPEISVRRADEALKQFAEERLQERDERTRKQTQLDELRKDGLHEKLSLVEEALADLGPRLERARTRAEALRLLRDTMNEERQRAFQDLVRPISDKVQRLVSAVIGPGIRAHFGEDLLPGRLTFGDTRDLALEQLSAGTLDQVAMLTRLAFGERYARKFGRHAFVLDDPLVNCDRDRRNRILDILIRATKDLQVIILTCHPEQYPGLPDDRTLRISLDEARAALREE